MKRSKAVSVCCADVPQAPAAFTASSLSTKEEDALIAEYSADAIVNATGLSSDILAADPTVYPLRGALIRVINDGKRFPKVKEALAVTQGGGKDNGIVFIVPRNDRILILGGE